MYFVCEKCWQIWEAKTREEVELARICTCGGRLLWLPSTLLH